MKNPNTTARSVLQLAAVTTLGIGILTLLWPEQILQWFDKSEAASSHFVRFIGTALIGFAVANWLYSKVRDARLMLPGMYGNLTSLCLAIGVDVVGMISGALASTAWLILILHIGFASLFGYAIWLFRR